MAEATTEFHGTCEDPRLLKAGYVVCGSAGDTRWHWQAPGERWNDGYRSENAAVKAALQHLATLSAKGSTDE